MSQELEPATSDTVGATLQRVREAQGLKVAEIAKRLRLSVTQIEALEGGAYEKLPGRTFVRGFIRNYAKILQINAESLLAQSSVTLNRVLPPKAFGTTNVILLHTESNKSWRKYTIAAILLGLAALFIFIELKPNLITLSKGGGVALGDQVNRASVKPSINSVATTLGNSSASKTIVVIRSSIKLTFLQEAWAGIKDHYGNIIFSQVSPAGSQKIIEGEPPFSLVVGNASHVKIAYNGHEVDLTPHIKAEVARLKLP